MANHTTLDYIKMAISMGLVIFSIVIVTALIFGDNTKIAAEVHPAVAFILMWGCILWLSLVEGGKCAVVGLVPVDGELYKDSHPTTHKICALGHKGDNLDRYLMGRQFMVIFISFVINMCGAPLAGAEVFNFPSWLESIFLGTGVAMVLTVVVVGQLTTQINATTCMLDYINTHFMTFTLWVALLIEKTGVMHMCYLVKYLFYWLAGKPVVTNEAPRTTLQAIFFYGRCLWSIGILAFALAVTIDALFKGQTTMWAGVPEGVSVIVFFVLMVFAGLLEGMQIALFAVAKLPKSEQGGPIAMKTCELMFHGDEKAFARFNVGRQMFVTLCFFVIARVSTLDVTIGVDENIFGVSDSVQKFFNMGFLGAIIATILGSISWQLVASAFPREFLSNPLIYVFALICLALEATGICSGAWFLAIFHRKLNRLQNDEVYIGTAEERAAAKGKADSTSDSEEEAVEPVEAEAETAVAGSTDNV